MRIEDIKTQIVKTGFPRVIVYQGKRITDKTPACFCSQDGEEAKEISPEEAAEAFGEFMGVMPAGWYTVKILQNPSATANRRQFQFYKPAEDGAPSPMISGHQMQEAISAQVNAQVDAFKRELEAEQEREALYARIGELEQAIKDSQGWQPKVMGILTTVAKFWMQKQGIPGEDIAGAVAGMAAPDHIQVENQVEAFEQEEEEEGTEVLRQSIGQMVGKIDEGQTLVLLQNLAQLPPEKLEKLSQLKTDDVNQLASFL